MYAQNDTEVEYKGCRLTFLHSENDRYHKELCVYTHRVQLQSKQEFEIKVSEL